jgi:hypothetical protein
MENGTMTRYAFVLSAAAISIADGFILAIPEILADADYLGNPGSKF